MSRTPESGAAPAWKTALAYLAVYLAWGSTYFAIKIGISRFSVSGMTGTRFVLAGTMMGLFWALRRGPGRGRAAAPRELAWAALVGMVMLGGGTGFLGYAERTVPSGVCALIIASSPILFAVFNRWAGGPRLAWNQVAGGVLSLAGVALLTLQGSSWSSGAPPLRGLLILAAGMVCWTGASVASKRLPLPADTALSASAQMLAAGALMLVLGLALDEYRPADLACMPRQTALAVFYLAVVGSCLGFTAYSWLLRREPANRVSSYAFVNPVVAVFLGVGLGGERFTAPIAAAMVAVTAGVMLSLFGGRWPRLRFPQAPAEQP